MQAKFCKIIGKGLIMQLSTSINWMRKAGYSPPNLVFAATDGRYGRLLGQQDAYGADILAVVGHGVRYSLLQIRKLPQRLFAGDESGSTAFSAGARFISGETRAGAGHLNG